MSQDLLAAFGGTEQPVDSQSKSNQGIQSSFFDDLAQGSQDVTREEGDDEWGDFEGPITEEQGIESQIETLTLDSTEPQPSTILGVATKPVSKAAGSGKPSIGEPPKKEPRDPNILFDADEDLPIEEEDGDDFGEFEGTEEVEAVSKLGDAKPAEVDLLGLEDMDSPSISRPSNPQTVSQPASSLLDLEDLLEPAPAPKTTTQSQPAPDFTQLVAPETDDKAANYTIPSPLSFSRPVAKPPPSFPSDEEQNLEEDEPWEDFTSSVTPSAPSALPFTIPKPTAPPQEPTSPHPPTNVPPPAILLSLFPSLLTTLSSSFSTPLSTQPPDIKHQIYTSPETLTYLKSYIALSIVCARIIAGRKSRWKRDSNLAQSMRIGAAGSKGGMKVTSLDRVEAQREDREVADVLRVWQGQVGRLRSAVAEVRKAVVGTEREGGVEGLVVPEIRETMGVRAVGVKEGGVVGVRACAVCGLRREERVHRVDGEVFDGFGEWWVEGVEMHRACRNFWVEHESKLRQR